LLMGDQSDEDRIGFAERVNPPESVKMLKQDLKAADDFADLSVSLSRLAGPAYYRSRSAYYHAGQPITGRRFVKPLGHGKQSQCLGRRIVSRSEAFSIPLTLCGSPVGR
jgi:hypothetical protein